MFGRRRKPPEGDISEALAAQQRAREEIDKVSTQETEVLQLVHSLETRRLKNNFGDALVLAMEKRNP